jgi:hypothetical protein
MRYLLTILTVITALATVCILILFISVFIAWLGGGFNIVLPGLGLVIGAPLVLIVLFLTGAIMFSLTVLLFRTIYKPLR